MNRLDKQEVTSQDVGNCQRNLSGQRWFDAQTIRSSVLGSAAVSNSMKKDSHFDWSSSFQHVGTIAMFCLASVFSIACTGELTPNGGGSGGVDGGGGVDAGAITAREMQYRDTVEPIFSAARGGGGACTKCHRDMAIGPLFLGTDASAGYASIVANNEFITNPGTDSLLVTKGPHSGAEALAAGEITTVAKWVDAEVAAKQ